MKWLFVLFWFFLLSGCDMSQGVDRNYIISHTQKEEIVSPNNP